MVIIYLYILFSFGKNILDDLDELISSTSIYTDILKSIQQAVTTGDKLKISNMKEIKDSKIMIVYISIKQFKIIVLDTKYKIQVDKSYFFLKQSEKGNAWKIDYVIKMINMVKTNSKYYLYIVSESDEVNVCMKGILDKMPQNIIDLKFISPEKISKDASPLLFNNNAALVDKYEANFIFTITEKSEKFMVSLPYRNIKFTDPEFNNLQFLDLHEKVTKCIGDDKTDNTIFLRLNAWINEKNLDITYMYMLNYILRDPEEYNRLLDLPSRFTTKQIEVLMSGNVPKNNYGKKEMPVSHYYKLIVSNIQKYNIGKEEKEVYEAFAYKLLKEKDTGISFEKILSIIALRKYLMECIFETYSKFISKVRECNMYISKVLNQEEDIVEDKKITELIASILNTKEISQGEYVKVSEKILGIISVHYSKFEAGLLKL